METAMINEVRDTFAPAQLATASLNFGVGRSRSFCIKSTIWARTPGTQNFCQLLSFGCEFLKLHSISLFVFLWDVCRVSPGITGYHRVSPGITRPGCLRRLRSKVRGP